MLVIPALREAEVGRSQGQEFEMRLANMVKLHSPKNTKVSQAWWWAPIIPATWEAEAGELLELGGMEAAVSRDRVTALQPGNRARLCLKNIN